MTYEYDERDQAIVAERAAFRMSFNTPLVGDFIMFATGEVERVSHVWHDSVQTSPVRAGTIYLGDPGFGSFSGGLNPSIPSSTIAPTGEMREGTFWIFHHDIWGAGRAVYFDIPCRVYETTAPYNGWI